MWCVCEPLLIVLFKWLTTTELRFWYSNFVGIRLELDSSQNDSCYTATGVMCMWASVILLEKKNKWPTITAPPVVCENTISEQFEPMQYLCYWILLYSNYIIIIFLKLLKLYCYTNMVLTRSVQQSHMWPYLDTFKWRSRVNFKTTEHILAYKLSEKCILFIFFFFCKIIKKLL